MTGSWMSTRWPIVALGASWRVDREPMTPSIAARPSRLWKCRRRGNHRPVSTAPWKSRTEREIPTFPQADDCRWVMRSTTNATENVTRAGDR